jgi:N-acyl-D-aspartate/D-glutamate deacylase
MEVSRAMRNAHDLVIRGGRVVDGSGGLAFEADVAVKDGLIATPITTARRPGTGGCSPRPGTA